MMSWKIADIIEALKLFVLLPLSFYYLISHFGFCFLYGVVVIAVSFVFTLVVTHIDWNAYYAVMKNKTARLVVISEVVNSIKAIKLGALEHVFLKKMTLIREKELASISDRFFYIALTRVAQSFFDNILSIVIFVSYVQMGY